MISEDKLDQDLINTLPTSSSCLCLKLKLQSIEAHKELLIPSSSVVRDVIIKVREIFSIDSNKNVRLIYSGKLLQPVTLSLEHFKVKTNSFLHVVLNDLTTNQSCNNHSNIRNQNTTGLSSGSNTGGNSSFSTIHLPRSQLRGFDVLLTLESDNSELNPYLRPGYGMTVHDVASLRTHFRSHIDQYIHFHNLRREVTLANSNLMEDELSFRLRAETLWLNDPHQHNPNSEFCANLPLRRFTNSNTNINNEGINDMNIVHDDDDDNDDSDMIALLQRRGIPMASHLSLSHDSGDGHGGGNRDGIARGLDNLSSDYMFGFSLGMFFGFLMIFCLWDRNVSQSQKRGIMAGILFQFLIQSFRETNNPVATRHSSGPGTEPNKL